MKNVLQFIGSFHQGGSERQAVQLTRLLREDGSFNVLLATLNKEGALLEEIGQLNLEQIPEFKLTSFYNANFLREVQNCAKFIRHNRIEIVHTHDFYTNIFGMCAAALARVPLKIASKRETGGMRSRSQKIIEKFAFRQANVIVANSEAVKNYLISEGNSAERIRVVYNGLDLQRMITKIIERKAICAEIGLPSGENIRFITLVANLHHTVKNQPMFLRVAKRVTQKFPNAHFVLAGEGELLESLKDLASELKVAENTHFIGRCNRIPELLSASFAGVLTSFNEGFSNSILEYMAAEKPVVATRVGGASEAIVENETGFLVDSDDDETMARRLVELLRDDEKARKFGKKGRQFAEERFSGAAQLENTLKLYRKI